MIDSTLISTSSIFILLWIAQPTNVSAQQMRVNSVLIRLIHDVDVPARASGELTSMEVVEGQFVKKGTRLAQIDDIEARALYRRATIELQISEKQAEDDVAIRKAEKTHNVGRSDVHRLKKAAEEFPRSVSQTQLEEAVLRADHAELEIEGGRRKLGIAALTMKLKAQDVLLTKRNVEVRRIRAPLSGVVVEVSRGRGEWVEAGDKVLRIVRLDRLRAEGFMQFSDAAQISEGTNATVVAKLPSQQEREFTAKIVFVSPEVNAVNGQVRVWAEVDNPDGLLRPGLRSQLLISPGRSTTPTSLPKLQGSSVEFQE